MKFRLTDHFKLRYGEREINFDHVKSAIHNPDFKRVVFEGRIKVTKKIGSRMIEVIYFKDEVKNSREEYLLITAYYI